MARLDDLKDLRVQLLRWVEDAPIDRKAPLVAQLRATVEEIEKLSPKQKAGDAVDEIAQRRAARRSGTTARSGRAKRTS